MAAAGKRTAVQQPLGGWQIVGLSIFAVTVVATAAVLWNKAPNLYPEVAGAADRPEVAAAREATRSQAIVATRTSILAALAGIGALVSIFINYRNSLIATATLATTNESFRVAERGHITDRYTQAVEQLGNDVSLTVRLGGIYALEQLAVDSENPRDQDVVVEVLSAFARTRHSQNQGPLSMTAPDLEAVVSVLGRLPDRGSARRGDLSGIVLPFLALHGANLSRVVLRNAVLTNCDMNGVDFTGADLREANFKQARLVSARFDDSDCSGAGFEQADLTGATLRRARASRANFTRAKLWDADLSLARCAGANFQSANAKGAVFAKAVLDRADLSGARLTKINLREALLTNANLQSANLGGADCSDADFAKANVLRTRMNGASFKEARGKIVGANQGQLSHARNVPRLWRKL